MIPQGSVLGPLLFTMYVYPLTVVFYEIDLPYHSYADHNQLHPSTKVEHFDSMANVKNLEVTIESNLSMNATIFNIRKCCYFELRKIAHLRPFINQHATEKLVLSFVIDLTIGLVLD